MRLLRPPPPKVSPRQLHALRLPMLLERLSVLSASVRLPRRNSPIAEVDESALDASSYDPSSHDGGRDAEEALKDVRSRMSLSICLSRVRGRNARDRSCTCNARENCAVALYEQLLSLHRALALTVLLLPMKHVLLLARLGSFSPGHTRAGVRITHCLCR